MEGEEIHDMIRRTRSTAFDSSHRAAHRSRAASPLALALCLALLGGVACKDDGGSGSVALEGTYSNEAPAAASAGIVVGPADCELDFDAFAVVQRGDEAMILPGLGGGEGGPVPGTLDEDDLLQVDYEVENTGLGFVQIITGTLDASLGGQLVGSLTVEIAPIGAPTSSDCGPTVFPIDASRGTSSLPAPSDLVEGADGDWVVSISEIDTTCEPVLGTDSVDLNVVTDVDDASAVVTFDDDGEMFSVDAVLTDDFVVAKWNTEEDGEVERNLTAMRYELFPVALDVLFGVNTVVVDDGETTCTARDDLQASRPPAS